MKEREREREKTMAQLSFKDFSLFAYRLWFTKPRFGWDAKTLRGELIEKYGFMCEADFHFSFLFSPFFMHFHIKAHILIFFFARFVFQFEMFLISIQHFFSGRFSRSHLSGRDKNAGGSFRFFHPLLSYLVWHLHVMKYIVCECWHTKKKITSYFQKFIFINKKEKSIFMENFKWHQKYNVPTISREKN